MAERIYNRCITKLRNPCVLNIIQMNVSVYHICGLEFFKEPAVAFETSVTWVLLVMNIERRSVRQKNVQIAPVFQFIKNK